jgi:dienelactone hydrolase
MERMDPYKNLGVKPAVFVAAVLACAGSFGCSDDTKKRECFGEPYCEPPSTAGPQALFYPPQNAPDELKPFPADHLTREDPTTETGIRLDLQRFPYKSDLNLLDGFGTFAPIVVQLDEDLDETAISGDASRFAFMGSPVFLFRTDGLADSDGLDLRDRMVPLYLSYMPEDRLLFVLPEIPLEPATPYALVVTSCLNGASGGSVRESDTFNALKRSCPGGFTERYCRAVHGILDYLSQPTICLFPENVALALSFTTRTTTAWLEAVRDWIEAQPPPDATIDQVLPGSDATGNLNPDFLALYPGLQEELQDIDLSVYPFDSMGDVVLGTFDAWRLYDPETGLPMAHAGTGAPDPQDKETLQFILVTPPQAPPSGAPLVIFQHAFTVCKETIVALAGTFGKAGLAVAGIDIVRHGSRSVDGPGSCSIGPFDFMNLSKFQLSNSRFEQTVVDLLQFSRMLKHMDLDVSPQDGQPDVDGSQLGFIGQSVGAFMGAVFVALDPDVRASVINVGGSGVSLFFISGMVGDTLTRPDYAMLPIGWELFVTFQTVAEGAEPANHIRWLRPDGPHGPRDLLLQEAFEDEVVPNYNTEAFARLLGLPHVAPVADPADGLEPVGAPFEGNLPSGRTAGMYRFQPAQHAFLLLDDPQDAPGATFQGQIQAAAFLKTALESGSGIIIDPTDAAQIAQHAPFWDLPPPR